MRKIFPFLFVLMFAFLFSGCSLFPFMSSEPSVGGVLKSFDGGREWEFKNFIGEKSSLAGTDILSMAIHPVDGNEIYVGTRNNGIFVSEDGGEKWNKVNFPPRSIFGLVLNYFEPDVMYASGVWKGRAKIYKTTNSGEDWEEIYTEPADGTLILSLGISKINPNVLYAGTSAGVIIKTVNGGETWENFYDAKGPVTDIVFADKDMHAAYFEIYGKDVLITKDGGATFESLEKLQSEDDEKVSLGQVFSIAPDPNKHGTLYIGTGNGMYKSTDYGEEIKEINILSSSKEYPVRSITLNPKNSHEIIYNAAHAIYKSSDSGHSWSTFQLDTNKVMGNFLYNPKNTSIIYGGLRSYK